MPSKYEIHLIPSADGEGVLACVPAIPGLIAESDTEEQALADIKKLIEDWPDAQNDSHD